MTEKAKRISACRLCYANQFKEVFVLPSMPLTDEFVTADKKGSEFLSDIKIAICEHCGCVQNMNDTDMDDYYNDYTYTVQSSAFAIDFMRKMAERINDSFFIGKSNPKVIEIGSGSGEQLLEFKKLGFEVLGIEPSKKLTEYANGIGVKTLHAFYDDKILEKLPDDFKEVDLILSSYTFDHIPEPSHVLQTINRNLKEGGIMVHEVHDLNLIKQRNEYCLFEHEHYTYLNENTMKWVLAQNGFQCLTFNLLSKEEKRANSLLVASHKTTLIESVDIDVTKEISELQTLSKNIQESIFRIDNWLNSNKEFKIAAYGAGGRGVMTIAALDNFKLFRYLVDKNPKAQGIFAPKSHLPVYSIERLDEDRVDKILVFSFGYFNEIVEECCKRFNYEPQQFISLLDIIELQHA